VADFILDLFELSAVMAAAVIVLLLLRKPIGSRFSAWSRYLVWTLVVIRLCVPVGAGLADPVFTVTLPEKVTAEATLGEVTQIETIPPAVEQTEKTEQTLPPETGALTEAVTQSTSPAVTLPPSVVMPAESEAVRPQVTLPSVKEPTLESEKTPTEIDTRRVLSVIGYLWLAGALVYFAFRMGAYTLFTVRMKRELRSADGRVLRIYETLCTQLNIKRVPRLYVSRVPVSPMLYGYISPRIVIPDLEFADEEKICQMLIHELIHHRRGDIYVKLLCTAAIAVHWFNPAAYVAASRCVSAMELACDEAVVRTMNDSSRARYGETLLEIVRRCADIRTSSMTTGMNSRRSNVKERIMNILDTNKKKRGITIVAAVLCICMIAGGVVGCAVGDNTEKPDTPETDNATYYVPEYIKIVDSLDTYEAKLSFEGDTLVAERTKNGEADVTYTALYDGERLTSVEVRDAAGELIRTKSLSYDENGNVTLISYTSADNSREYSRTEYTYEKGLLASITYTEDDEPGRYKISYAYDENGRLLSEDRDREMFSNKYYDISYTYDNGRMTSRKSYSWGYGGYETLETTFVDGNTAITVENSGNIVYNSTYTYNDVGSIITYRIESDLDIQDDDNTPDWVEITNTYTEDGRHLIMQSTSGTSSTLANRLDAYDTKFDAEKLETSGFIYQGTQLKWRECNKAEYLRYCAVYETVDTLSEEAETGYLLDIDNHMWCFDDVVSDITDDAVPYVPFEGKNAANEAGARKEWYEVQLAGKEGSTIEFPSLIQRIEAFLTGDYETFAQLQEASEGALASYEGMELGEYTLSLETTDNGIGIVLDVEVLESKNEILKPGMHRFKTNLRLLTFLTHVSEAESWETPEEYHKFLHFALLKGLYKLDEETLKNDRDINAAFTGLMRMSMQGWLREKYADTLEEYYDVGSLKMRAEDIKEFVSQYYGFDDYEPEREPKSNLKGYAYRDGYFVHAGILGATVIPETASDVQANEDGSLTLTLTHWADMTHTVVSKRTRFTVTTAEDGTQIIKSAELLEDSGIAPAYGPST